MKQDLKAALGDFYPHAKAVVLGSAPNPILPRNQEPYSLICCNGSSFSARKLGVNIPDITVVSSRISDETMPAQAARNAMANSATRLLICLSPRLRTPWYAVNRRIREKDSALSKAREAIAYLSAIGLKYETARIVNQTSVINFLLSKVGRSKDLQHAMRRQKPSTGMLALGIQLAYSQNIPILLSGFTLTTEHAYQDRQSGTDTKSRHLVTDTLLLAMLSEKYANVATTENALSEKFSLRCLA